MPEWWNGRHARLKIECRKAWEFESLLRQKNYANTPWIFWHIRTRNIRLYFCFVLKAAACPVAPPKADGIGELHRWQFQVFLWRNSDLLKFYRISVLAANSLFFELWKRRSPSQRYYHCKGLRLELGGRVRLLLAFTDPLISVDT